MSPDASSARSSVAVTSQRRTRFRNRRGSGRRRAGRLAVDYSGQWLRIAYTDIIHRLGRTCSKSDLCKIHAHVLCRTRSSNDASRAPLDVRENATSAQNERRRDWWREPVARGDKLTIRSIVTAAARNAQWFEKRGAPNPCHAATQGAGVQDEQPIVQEHCIIQDQCVSGLNPET
jgi:hypothetical protein